MSVIKSKVQIPVSVMKQMKEKYILDDRGRMFGGLLGLEKHDNVYLVKLTDEVFPGSKNKFNTGHLPGANSKHNISFFTMPIMAYKKLGMPVFLPNVDVYREVLRGLLTGYICHLMFSIEGVYVFRMNSDVFKYLDKTNKCTMDQFIKRFSELIKRVVEPYREEISMEMNRLMNTRLREKGITLKRTGMNKNIKYEIQYKNKRYNFTNASFLSEILTNKDANNMKTLWTKKYNQTVKALSSITLESFGFFDQSVIPAELKNEQILQMRLYRRKSNDTSVSLPSDYTKAISFVLEIPSKMKISPSRKVSGKNNNNNNSPREPWLKTPRQYFRNGISLENLEKRYKYLALRLHPNKPGGIKYKFNNMKNEYNKKREILNRQ